MCVSYEADPRHAEEIIKQSGAKDMKPVTSPIVKETKDETAEDKVKKIEEMKRLGGKGAGGDGEELSRERVRDYRGIAARGNFLAMDRGDII